MNDLLEQRFTALWQHLGLSGDPVPVFQDLAARYEEPHRAYHNLRHITECLELLDTVPTAPAVEIALWFHDAVYDPQARDNEERSAELAATCLKNAGAPADFIPHVEALILTTKRHTPEDREDFALISDIDLSILGRAPSRFDEYEQDIRREYAWVSDEDFAKGRGGFLESVLARPAIFLTDHFHDLLERPARANITRSLEALMKTIP